MLLYAAPLALTVWALLDAARRPAWAWALAGRRRVVWLAAILFGGMVLVVGVVVSGVYLLRIRPAVAAAEQGVVVPPPPGAGPTDGSGTAGPNSPSGGGP